MGLDPTFLFVLPILVLRADFVFGSASYWYCLLFTFPTESYVSSWVAQNSPFTIIKSLTVELTSQIGL